MHIQGIHNISHYDTPAYRGYIHNISHYDTHSYREYMILAIMQWIHIISHYDTHIQGIHDQIDGLEDFVSAGWIGINMKPAKHLVSGLITKWIYACLH